MNEICEYDRCTGCGACAHICPKECIKMESDSEGFLHPSIQTDNCVNCNRCQQVCPVLTEYSLEYDGSIAYAAINTDEKTRLESTSGGVFTLLCQWVLEKGGVVFGAAYDESFSVVHCCVEKCEDLHKLRGAKYAQSTLGDAFKQVQNYLKVGKYVLFSGTPCQIGGLIAFLGNRHERLIMVDLICHGVPSPKVWDRYIDYRSETDASGMRPSEINLRSKETGWPGYSIRFDYPKGECYSALNSMDPYLRGFVGNLYLRPSCYNCIFKGSTRQSDFTLGDYWGVWSQHPDYHDGIGTSLVLLHSEKAKKIWKSISINVKYEEVGISEALADNPSALVASPKSQMREAFFESYQQGDFSLLIDKMCPKTTTKKQSFLRRVLRKIRQIMKKHDNEKDGHILK